MTTGPDPETGATSTAAAGRPATTEVVLATHNSTSYLAELLDSLFTQTWQDFTLLVADDGSSDTTLQILSAYSDQHPGRIRLVAETNPARGPRATFSLLLDQASADHVMFCDHDDVWLPHKIEMSERRMAELEAERGAEVPILLHSDLAVVSSALEPIGHSFFAYTGLDPRRHGFEQLLMSNVATGCATMVNRALYQRARPVPQEAIMHDWWLALVASCFGSCSFLNQVTLLYRQHGANVIGARPLSKSATERIWKTLLSGSSCQDIRAKSRQAAALLERYGREMTDEQVRAAEALANIWSTGRLKRWRAFRRSGFAPRGLLGNLALFLALARG